VVDLSADSVLGFLLTAPKAAVHVRLIMSLFVCLFVCTKISDDKLGWATCK